MICHVSGEKDLFYKILTPYGYLADSYRADDLEPYCGLVNVQIDDYATRYKKISLRKAAALSVNRGELAEIITSCNCNNVCTDDNRCKCFKAKVKCSSHCHGKSKIRCCTNVEKTLIKSKKK